MRGLLSRWSWYQGAAWKPVVYGGDGAEGREGDDDEEKEEEKETRKKKGIISMPSLKLPHGHVSSGTHHQRPHLLPQPLAHQSHPPRNGPSQSHPAISSPPPLASVSMFEMMMVVVVVAMMMMIMVMMIALGPWRCCIHYWPGVRMKVRWGKLSSSIKPACQ